MTALQQRRLDAGVSLRELSRALGPGFSRAKINFAERGVIRIAPHQLVAILEAIDRLASLSERRKRIIETARDLDFAEFFNDIRQRATAPDTSA